ncbi:WXG100 family type VII secretion target [Amycolatopsis rifamycinica]|uniref:Uncharacterized protein n=1 Tax=Amycolatopsis rifamycinica TaxID=287986 RepID=A0A066UD74_9PSEU|nr:WXG100 family type VII secretion target [Amycolatopsis rifamycinica]KDN22094.1 hypothetical protein DV20_11980 [Amycolatopsis rifamycinica]
MTTPPAAPPDLRAQPQPYPEDADARIRQIAEIFGHDNVLRLLGDVRNRLLGNALQVQSMAMDFAQKKDLSDAGDDVAQAALAVAGTWSGRGADQFTGYAELVGKALEGQQEVVASMSGILSEIAGCIIDTYAKAIEFIGNCAVELGKVGYKTIIAIATAEIPILDVITSKEVVDTVADALFDLVKSVSDLFGQTFETLGKYRTQAIALVQGNTNFPDMPPMPGNSGINDQRQWRIDPSAAPA